MKTVLGIIYIAISAASTLTYISIYFLWLKLRLPWTRNYLIAIVAFALHVFMMGFALIYTPQNIGYDLLSFLTVITIPCFTAYVATTYIVNAALYIYLKKLPKWWNIVRKAFGIALITATVANIAVSLSIDKEIWGNIYTRQYYIYIFIIIYNSCIVIGTSVMVFKKGHIVRLPGLKKGIYIVSFIFYALAPLVIYTAIISKQPNVYASPNLSWVLVPTFYIIVCIITVIWIWRRFFRHHISDDIDTFSKKNKLTQREREILIYIVEGFSNATIADLLEISLSTVKNHISSMLRKTGTGNRFELGRLN